MNKENIENKIGEADDKFSTAMESVMNPTEEEFQIAIDANLKALEAFGDEQELVIDDYPFQGEVYKVAELKKLIGSMRDKDNELSRGYPKILAILSSNPKEYFEKKNEQLEKSKKFYLNKLNPYPDDLLITYVHPNSSGYTDWRTGKVQYYQKTAGELRNEIQNMSWEQNEAFSHLGGINIVSTDPNVSMEELENHVKVNEQRFQAAVQYAADRASLNAELKHQLEKVAADLPEDSIISIPTEDGSSIDISVKKLKAKLQTYKKLEG